MPREYSLQELEAMEAKKSREYTLQELEAMEKLGPTPKASDVKQDSSLALGAPKAFTGNALDHELRAPTFMDGFMEHVGRPLVRGGAIGSGVIAGGVLSGGNPLGMALGGVAGDQSYQMGQRGAEALDGTEMWGKAPSNPVDSLTESALQSLLEIGGGKLVGKFSNLFKTKNGGILDRFFSRQASNNGEDVAAINANPDVPMTVGQATKGKLASWMEDVLAGGKKKKEFIDPAQDIFKKSAIELTGDISKRGTSYTDPNFNVELGKRTVKGAQFEAERTEGVIKKLYDNLRTSLKKNDSREFIVKEEPSAVLGPDGKPVTKKTLEPISGPIYLERSFDAAEHFTKIIDETIKSYTEKEFPEEAITNLRKARSILDPVINAQRSVQGKPVLSYEDHKALRSIAHTINTKLEGVDDLAKKKLAGMAGDLEDLLTVDKKESISKYWSPQSKSLISRADKYFQARAKRYDPAIAKQLQGMDADVAQEQLMDHALSNVENARKYIKLVGDKKELGAHYVANIFKQIETDGHFTGSTLLTKLTRDPGVYRTVLSSEQRQSLEYLGRTMEHIPPDVSNAGKYSLYFRGGVAALSLSPAAIGIAQGDDRWDTLLKSGGALSVLMGSTVFTKKYLMNPTKARQIAILARTPPGTPKANHLSKAIFGFGKVAQANLRELMVDGALREEEE